MMRVLVADQLPERSMLEMRALGVEVDYQPDLVDLRDQLAGVGVLVVRGTEVNAEALARANSLNLVIRAGAGVSRIDVPAASQRGIYVANCPGKNASAVAELTLALIGALDRRLVDATLSLRSGRWEKEEYAKAAGLWGRHLGVVGCGHVGRRVIELARHLGMEITVWSRSMSRTKAERLGVGYARNVEELARGSEILSLHLELVERTRAIVGRAELEALPRGAMLINTAQGGLIDWDALVELMPGKQFRLGLDALPEEPRTREGAYTHPILSAGTVYATPHIGASTDAAQRAIADECVRILRSFLTEGEVPNVVNISRSSSARYQLVVRHADRVGVLANTLSVLKRHGINIEELDNTVFAGGHAGCAKIRVDSRPSDGCLEEIRAFEGEVFHVDVVTLPNLA